MNAPADSAAAMRPESLLPLLHQAIVSLEAGDHAGFDKNMEALFHQREQRLTDGLVRIAQRVHQAIHNLDLDSRLACMAGREIPDAQTHLDHVVRMTEQAAHRTLDLVEDSRAMIDKVSRLQATLYAHAGVHSQGISSDQTAAAAFAELQQGTESLRANLTLLAQAQEYQDLSGQMIRRVIALIQAVEKALVDLLHAAGVDLKIPPDAPITGDTSTLKGPGAKNAASQQDADSLLADLGF
jgi:chemotaxis protein CheZ